MRRIFFSFHYQADIFRVNVVRNSTLTHDLDARESFFDGSLWEKAKLRNDGSLQNLIRDGMKNSSVVCVLAGTNTWQRPWVRYEIARAVVGNRGLVSVHINSIPDFQRLTKERGRNPLACMAVGKSGGQYFLYEYSLDGKWYRYQGYTRAINLPAYMPDMDEGFNRALSQGTREYDYYMQNGFQNLSGWAEDAALAVGRQ